MSAPTLIAHSRLRRRVVAFVAIYTAAYLLASYMDHVSTSLGLQRAGVQERNVLATDSAGYSHWRAWLLTAGGAVMMGGCIWFAVRNAKAVDRQWLHHPVRAFGRLSYVNPWSVVAIRVAPLQMLSVALAFVPLRLLAAANNLSVYWYGAGPMGELIKLLTPKTSPAAAFLIVSCLFFYPLVLALSPVAARLINSWRETDAPGGAN